MLIRIRFCSFDSLYKAILVYSLCKLKILIFIEHIQFHVICYYLDFAKQYFDYLVEGFETMHSTFYALSLITRE